MPLFFQDPTGKNEDIRIKNENDRVNDEKARIENEKIREQQEEERKSYIENIVKPAVEKVDEFGSQVTEIENEVKKPITPDKTTFFEHGKNLFNKNTVTLSKNINYSTGELDDSENFNASDYILVDENTQYHQNEPYSCAFYDSDKIFVSGQLNGNIINTPSNCKYVRLSIKKESMNIFQFEKGGSATFYEEYKEYIPNEKLEILITDNDIPLIPISKMDFAINSSNLFDKKNITEDVYIVSTDGSLSSANGFVASDWIEIKENINYIVKSLRHYAFYDENKKYINGANLTGNYSNIKITTPLKAKYIRFSFYPTDGATKDTQQVNEGDNLLPYEEYGFMIPSDVIKDMNVNTSCQINLPNTLYCVPNKQLRIRFGSVVTDYYKGIYDIKITCSKGKQNQIDWTYTPTITEQFPLTLSFYKDNILILSKQITIKVVSEIATEKSLKGIFLGDSTTNHGYYPKNFKSLCDSNANLTLELLGTRNNNGVNHEGRSGWTGKQYCTVASSGDIQNPFYNPTAKTFDFSYYMTQQGYSDLNFVNIHLGINDVFTGIESNETLSYITTIINSIKNYNSSLKILLNITIPPNPSQDVWGNAYGCSKALWEYYRDYNKFLKSLINTYANKEVEGVYLIGINSVLGDVEEYQDAVHGVYADNIGAYLKMAEQDYYAINLIFAQ